MPQVLINATHKQAPPERRITAVAWSEAAQQKTEFLEAHGCAPAINKPRQGRRSTAVAWSKRNPRAASIYPFFRAKPRSEC